MYAKQNSSRSTRTVLCDGNGREVVAFNATFTQRNVNLMVDVIDQEGYMANAADVQEAMVEFLHDLNLALSDASLPMILSEAKAK
ncbi:MAG: hypothetical protein IKO07_06110 [Clostridia bacterium]|nr:hypothetical protein [Clostridia bacterium]